MDGYSVGEITWLLALNYEDVLEEDFPATSLSQPDSNGSGDTTRVPTLARWAEVRAAAARVIKHKRDLEGAELVARGYTQAEVAGLLGASQQTVSRRFRATVAEILEELGGPVQAPADATSGPAACLLCGVRPRARAAAVTRRVRGGVQVLRAERELGVCAACADPGSVGLLTGRAAA
jgi:hypothetical protein